LSPCLHIGYNLLIYSFFFVERTKHPKEYYHISVVPEKDPRVTKLGGELSRKLLLGIHGLEFVGSKALVRVMGFAT